MTPEEITRLAEEYAVEVTKDMAKTLDEPSCLLNETKRATKEYITDFMQWLLRTHCIVSKEKATELCRLTLEHGDSIDYGLIDGLTDIVCDIFGEQYHAEAEKNDFDPDTFNETDK